MGRKRVMTNVRHLHIKMEKATLDTFRWKCKLHGTNSSAVLRKYMERYISRTSSEPKEEPYEVL